MGPAANGEWVFLVIGFDLGERDIVDILTFLPSVASTASLQVITTRIIRITMLKLPVQPCSKKIPCWLHSCYKKWPLQTD
ncbi:MAG: hypothetical protein RQ722_13150, partial [Desulfuromonadales bacterium]|nr:hypothetical protein [Desulfuromonadales bacterium]